jgi:hypothetical protein
VTSRWWAAALVGAATACSPPRPVPAVTVVPLGAAPGSAAPKLTTAADGTLYVSWIEPVGDRPDPSAPGGDPDGSVGEAGVRPGIGGGGHVLRFASWRGAGWTAPRTISSDRAMMVNWADVPSLVGLSDGGMLAQWLRKRPGGGYQIELARSSDHGATWSAPFTPHGDDSDTEHGFVSMVARPDGGALAVWLDGRAFVGLDEATAERRAAMALRYARLDGAMAAGGATTATLEVTGAPADAELDPRTCSCCQTAAVAVGQDVVVAYRDRSPAEIRDITVTRLEAGRWSPAVPVFSDGWRIDGCPVNGPALAADGQRVALAWFTAANDVAQVKLALSEDGGRHFGPPIRIDDGHPQGRVDVVVVSDHAVVSWQELRGATVELRVRGVRGGQAARSQRLLSVPAGRNSGFAHIGRVAHELIAVWTGTAVSGEPQVVTGKLPLAAL